MNQILKLDNGMVIEIGFTSDDFIKGTQSIKVKHEDNKYHSVILVNTEKDIYQFTFRYNDFVNSIKVTRPAMTSSISDFLEIEGCDLGLLNELIETAIQHIHIVDSENIEVRNIIENNK